jgi:RNA polymerase sigma factor (sigma-70 family)
MFVAVGYLTVVAPEEPADTIPSLLARAGTGDEAAVHALLTRYLDDLRRYISTHAGQKLKARETSQDLLQSVCREVLQDAADGGFRYRSEGQFRGFLFQAALNKIRGKGRYHGRKRRAADQELPADALSRSLADAVFLTMHTPSRSAADREEHARFLQAFAQLPETQQQLIQWARLDGLSHREIAQKLSISEVNSRVQLGRALARLATLAVGPQ